MRKRDKKLKIDCACDECVNCCKNTPGWFLPDELAPTAKLLGISVEELKKKYLINDYWEGEGGSDPIDIWTPFKKIDYGNFPRYLISRDAPGSHASFGYAFLKGRCVFLDDNDRCMIHEAKPFECRVTTACGKDEQPDRHWRKDIALEWEKAAKKADAACA